MKKSFMTRALATGLSFAMAFSMSAATNVTTAAAAAKPAMKSTKMTVKVGQSKNYKATAATQKAYKIVKVKLSKAGKTKADVKINSSKKSIKVTGKAATKGSNVIITFKNTKTKKKTNVTTKVVVKAVEENTAYNIVSAEATGAKTVTVTLNKAVADASKVTVALKKGAVAKDSKFTVDGTKVVITTDTKLMAGNYNVTVGGLETTDLTAAFDVAKDETLTSYEVGAELIADADAATKGSIYYKALNQYGEMMTADAPTVTCTFTSKQPDVAVTATATREGRIDLEDINTSLAILGTKGNVILVDQTLGVNQTSEITYSAASTAAEVTVDGMYNSAKSAFQEITAKDNVSDYYLLLTVKDQYGHQLSYKDIKKDVSVVIAGGITHVESDTNVNSADTAKGLKDFTIGGTDYIAAVLTGTAYTDTNNNKGQYLATAGTATLTMVNNKRGLLLTHNIEVTDYVVAANFSVSADNGIYNKQENEMTFEATDTNGNAITSYAVLSKLIGLPSNWSWEKQKDGSAKLIFEPDVTITSNASRTGSTLSAAVFSLNEATSQNYKIKTQNFTVREDREAVSVYGLASDATTQFSAKEGKLSIKTNKIIFADQYANKITKDEDKIYPTIVTTGAFSAGSCGALIVTGGNFTTAKISGSAFEFESTEKGAYATVYLKYYSDFASKQDNVSDKNYDYKFVVTCVDTEGISNSSLAITSVNDGYVEKVGKTSSSAITVDDITVKATVAGSSTKLDSSQYIIKSIENGSFTQEEINKGVDTKTATVTIQVTTFDNDNNPTNTELKADYTISYADDYAASIKEVSVDGKAAMSATTSAGALTVSGSGVTLDAQLMQSLFTFRNQYGDEMTVTTTSAVQKKVSYNIVAKNTTNVKVYGEDSNSVYATGISGLCTKLTITAAAADGKAVTKDFMVYFK